MFNAPLLGNGRCRGNRIMAAMLDIMGCDHTSFFQIGPLTGDRVIAFPTFFNMAAVRHLELEFCHSGPPTKSTVLFGCPVKIWCRSDFCRRRYCDFMILLVWLLMLNHTSFLGVLIPENCGLPSTPPKGTFLDQDASFKP